ncbi:DEAD-box ATP-dependent RNA helicase 21 [Tripterygium wilfordii]|uniref:DEAD-box ATP-dependent RNA helicase 21 n=1 Tax=Tripterygium wilfordii TaxID=458696 RepID=A0A7J7DH63_TRIWF|nr:DEAD-box ATP-dependent RNA helicase 21 [Tripterygium wilfordii]
MRSWDESKLTTELLKAVEMAGYETPTPIQMAVIALGLGQRDVIGISKTGSGQTAAFVLSMFTRTSCLPMSEENKAQGPHAFIIAPIYSEI